MEKIKEYKGVPKKYIILAGIVCFAFGWFMPAPLSVSFGVVSLSLILSAIGMMIVHELLHGIWFKVFTGKVKFGAVLIKKILPYAFYATSPKSKLTRNQFLVIGLFPQILAIPCALVALLSHNPLAVYLAIFVYFMNLMGGISDIWAVFTLARYSKDTLVEDTMTGMIIYQP